MLFAPPSPGDVTGPAPDPSLDVMLLNEAAAVLERDRRVGVTPSTVASCGEMIAAIRRAVGRLNDAENVSRGDVTGTPALRDALWQATYALDRAYLHAHAFPRGCIQGCPHRACVDDPCECGYEAGLAKIYAAVRAGQRVLMAAALSEIDTQGSRPDLAGETPPASAETWYWCNNPLCRERQSWHERAPICWRCETGTLIAESRILGGGPPPETTREGQ